MRRRGLSLVEVVVALGVIGLLISLLLPAIQVSREASRRAQCVSREKQMGLALAGFESLHGGYHPVLSPVKESGIAKLPVLSQQVYLLPHLDHSSLFAEIDLSDCDGVVTGAGAQTVKNSAILSKTVSEFLCPSDPRAIGGANSYRFCTGTSPGAHETTNRPQCEAALRGFTAPFLRAAKVKDGLSNTIFLSEHPVGDGRGEPFDLRRDLLAAGPAWFLTPDDAKNGCAAVVFPSPAARRAGVTWLIGGYLSTWYNHVVPPNSSIPDCQGTDDPSGGAPGSVVARSEHVGGVNALWGDGSVRFVSDNIAPCVWRAVATYDGAEPTGNE